jgi:large subunit ribosomal protein L15
VEYVSINLDALQALAEKYNLTAIDFDTFREHGLASKNDLVKVLGRGEIKSKLDITAHAFSATAQKAIEAVGGAIVKL